MKQARSGRGIRDGRQACYNAAGREEVENGCDTGHVWSDLFPVCRSTANSHRTSAIIFKCDEDADIGRPQVFSETRGCEVTFEWKTKVVCPPKKMECKFIQKHKTYDLRLLSSLTGSWFFVHQGAS